MAEELDKDLDELMGDLESSGESGEDISLDDALGDLAAEGAGQEASGEEAATEAPEPAEAEGESVELDADLASMLGESEGEGESAGEVEAAGDEEDILGGEAPSGGEEDILGGGAPAPTESTDILAGLGEESGLPAGPRDTVNLDYLLDIKLNVTFEVGRAKMLVSDLLTLGQGSVIELHRLVGDELDLLINGRLVAKGEVVVVNEKFGCKITSIIPPEQRVKHLGGF